MGAVTLRSVCWTALGLLGSLIAGADTEVASVAPGDVADLSRLNFARLVYDSDNSTGEAFYAYDGRVWARWETDFPQGDENVSARLAQITRVTVNPRASRRTLTSPDLGDFPLLYVSDPGWMILSEKEKEGFARYLGNGGFVWVDDFWGDAEWQNFADIMQDVLPGVQWRVINNDHPIYRTVFELNELPQIPAIAFSGRGTAEPPFAHKDPAGSTDQQQMRGWFDEQGRLMVLATHNTDIGDGWEREAYGQWYFETFSTKSYMVAVNVVTYAMTH
jgi:hypothetical protein